jgi:ABC-type polysaccharide/polyol phosphate transport system ATPase subunit
MTTAVAAHGLGVRFFFDRQHRVVTPALARIRRRVTDLWGLRNVSFSLAAGEGIALIGPSGSGKTTLLRTLAGVLTPDAGSVAVRGRVASLLSVEAGLMSALTGSENAQLLGVLEGLSRREARRALAEIAERSGLVEVFDNPVSSYSQGMRARLGFAVAEQIRPQVLLLDEILEALDHEFRDYVVRRAEDVRAGGGIVVAAGHDHTILGRLCERGILLEQGTVLADGDFDDVRGAYTAAGSSSGDVTGA